MLSFLLILMHYSLQLFIKLVCLFLLLPEVVLLRGGGLAYFLTIVDFGLYLQLLGLGKLYLMIELRFLILVVIEGKGSLHDVVFARDCLQLFLQVLYLFFLRIYEILNCLWIKLSAFVITPRGFNALL